MKRFFNRQDIGTSLVLAVIGAIAGFTLSSMQWTQMDESMKSSILAQLGSREVLIILGTVQVAFLTLITSFLGVKLARRADLEVSWIPARQSWVAIGVVAAAAALVIALSDRLFFAPYLPEAVLDYRFSLGYLTASVLYGGIIEEVLLRLFVMSLLVFVARMLFFRRTEKPLPIAVYVGAIVLAAVLFAAGHLPATAQLLGLSGPIILRAFLLNGLAGLGFGYLFWKHGLGSAMAAHIATHILIQLVIMPVIS